MINHLKGSTIVAETASTIEQVIRSRRGFTPIDFKELWHYRELFLFLAWRDIIVRYKQTAVGIAWALMQPVVTMVVFTVIFGKLAKLPSNGASYAVMTFAAVLPWQFFSTVLSQGTNSIVGSSNIIQKVYFPRLIIPGSTTLSGVVDFTISFTVLLVLMVWYQVPFRLHLMLLPLFFALGFAAAFGMSLWLATLNVKYRDVRHVVPFIIRIGVYVSPVGFMSSVIPGKWQFLYSLNPLVGVIDGFRWAILGPEFEPYWPGVWASITVALALLVTGAYYFRAMERSFADVI